MEKGEDLNKILKMPSADFSSGAGFQMTREKRHCFVEALLYESDKFQNLLSFIITAVPNCKHSYLSFRPQGEICQRPFFATEGLRDLQRINCSTTEILRVPNHQS